MERIGHFSFSLLAALALLVGLGTLQAQAQALRVAEVTVDINATGNITATGITNGTVHYNHTSKTLTLTEATIDGGSATAVSNKGVEGLTIQLVGDNIVKNSDPYQSAMNIHRNTTITGPGTLLASGKGLGGIYVFQNTTLTIDGVSMLTATGKKKGIEADDIGTELVIRNSTVRTTGTEEYSIGGFATFTLDGYCDILTPEGAKYDNSLKGVAKDGALVKGEEVVITTMYGIKVKGVHVTALNEDNVLGDGKVQFVPGASYLRFKNVNIKHSEPFFSEYDGLQIELVGSNSLIAEGTSNGMVLKGNTEIYGDGLLTVKGDTAISVDGGNLDISGAGCTVIAESTNGSSPSAIVAVGGTENLIIYESTVNAKGSIQGFDNLNLTGSDYVKPTGASYKDVGGIKAVYDASDVLAQEVAIGYKDDLYIKGVQVTAINAHDILGDGGSVTFSDISGNLTLTLNNATIEHADSTIFHKMPSGLIIKLIGDNFVSSTTPDAGSAMLLEGVTAIIGSGTLTARGHHGILVNKSNFWLQDNNTTVIAQSHGSGHGVAGVDGTETLVVEQGVLKATGAEGSIANFDNLDLSYGPTLVQPLNVSYRDVDGNKAVYYDADDALVTSEVVIAQPYHVIVKGMMVAHHNAHDVLGDGTVSYNHANRTLTLNNANIDGGVANAIRNNGVEELTIRLKGSNKARNTGGMSAIGFYRNTTITGPGTLAIDATAGHGAIFVFNDYTLTIDGVSELVANGKKTGIEGGDGGNATLIIRNSTVRATGTNSYSIAGFETFTLDGCEILEPYGVAYDYSKSPKGIYLGSMIVKKEVFIAALAKSVSLSATEHTMKVGETFPLTATVTPAHAYNRELIWSSSDASVASVDASGLVTARASGTVFITVSTEDGSQSAQCELTVTQPVTGVSLNLTEKSLKVGEDFVLLATVSPLHADNQRVMWSSDRPGVAQVANGRVTALSAGVATITATTEDGGKTATCRVTVIQPVTGVSLSLTEKSLGVGEEFTLTATVSPSDATNSSVTWSSDNEAVATVNDGKVKALTVGTATITVTTEDGGKTATCRVTVTEGGSPVEGVMLSLALFPNPASSQITIDGLEAAAQVVIVNSLGSVVLSDTVHPNESIDVSALPVGVYVLRAEGVALRFVKE